MSALETEVLIIGAGVLGAATARELSRYKLEVTVVEKNVDVGWGITKANVGVVCQGRDTLEFRPEYHRTRLLWRALPLMEPLCRELDVPFKKVGAYLMIRDMNKKEKLDKPARRTESLGLGADICCIPPLEGRMDKYVKVVEMAMARAEDMRLEMSVCLSGAKDCPGRVCGQDRRHKGLRCSYRRRERGKEVGY